jgi:hypothetical protein
MKTIYSMGKGKYITLDSYGESHETRRSDVVVFLLASIIAAITIAAALGVDVTQFNTQSQQEQINATR